MSKNISIENAEIRFRNFKGEEGKFNPKGRRNFCVFLPDDFAEDLEEKGWNVKWLEPKDDRDADRQAYLQVGVTFDVYPPQIVLISGGRKTLLNEETIGILDWAEIEKADLIIRPYNWEVNGRKGIKAYVKALYVTLVEDEFEAKYRDIPDSAKSSMMGDD